MTYSSRAATRYFSGHRRTNLPTSDSPAAENTLASLFLAPAPSGLRWITIDDDAVSQLTLGDLRSQHLAYWAEFSRGNSGMLARSRQQRFLAVHLERKLLSGKGVFYSFTRKSGKVIGT